MNDAQIDPPDTHTSSEVMPALRRVWAHGRFDGPLFELTLRQTYENPADEPLEVAYTFPLPRDAAVLDFCTEFGGRRRPGAVVGHAEAEHAYERSMQGGDSPVLMQRADGALFAATLGNLKPGETMVVELRWAQWLRIEQGRVRVAVPTAIAPRRGQAGQRARLEPHQVPTHSIELEYPVEVAVEVLGPLAQGPVRCVTHPAAAQAVQGGVRLTLAEGATLDRDIVFTLTPPVTAWALQGGDRYAGEPACAAMVALVLPPQPARERICLKILVDCSGSMAGESLACARRTLAHVAQRLRPEDRVSYTRFGSRAKHDIGTLRPCNAATLAELLEAVAATEATLGDTDVERALRHAFDIAGADAARADVLLVTDGAVWGRDDIIRAVREARQRVFVIGVGHAPAEDVLREIAEAGGGACEFLTPRESAERAADRMLERIRQESWRSAELRWGRTPAWRSKPGPCFGGDTLIASAGFRGPLSQPGSVWARDAMGREVELWRFHCEPAQDPDLLARMAAATRLQGEDFAGAHHVALDYQLLSRHTRALATIDRALDDLVARVARQHLVPHMMPAGWGGIGRDPGPDILLPDDDDGPKARDVAPPYGAPCQPRDAPQPREPDESLQALVALAMLLIEREQPLEDMAREVLSAPWTPTAGMRRAIESAVEGGLTESRAWLLLALWIAVRDGDRRSAERLRRALPASLLELRGRVAPLFATALGRRAR